MRALGALALLGVLALPAVARAQDPLGLSSCAPAQGVHQCSGLVSTWDGVPLDATVTLPSASARRLPLVVEVHGFGNSKYEYLDPNSQAYTDNAYGWARAGYAVLTYTARGLWGSCGTPDSRLANPAACAQGYIHLADLRYEVRDTQELVGRLVDEDVADPAAIGVTGDSYGGGQSLMLDALRDRVMLPDGRLIPWRSPAGTRLRIAAAAPVIPWSDLVYAIAPNGRTLTYTITPPDADTSPVGVFKASFANGIFAAAQFATGPGQPVGEPFVPGRPMGFLAPAGTDPEADVASWVARADTGEPYDDAQARAIVDTLERHHAAYYVDPSRTPAPLFVASGFTDDLFPIDEALRFVNRLRRQHPKTPVSLMVGDFGHQRASNKTAERERLIARIHQWFDDHLRGTASAPNGVIASTQTCPPTAAARGPFTAATFAGLARGEVRFSSSREGTVQAGSGDPGVAAAIDPVAGGGNACATTATTPASGTVTYSLPAADGYTLLGAPTLIASLQVSGQPGVAQLVARLWDVAPGGDSQTLVARGLYRPLGRGTEVFQLHANGWTFAPGHVPKLELLGADTPYARPSNGSFEVHVQRLQLRLPVRDEPDCSVVMATAAPVVPAGQTLAPGVSSRAAQDCEPGSPARRRARRPRLRLRLRCTRAGLVARATMIGARARRVDFYVGRRRVARDRRAPFVRTVRRGRRARARVTVRARALLSGRRHATARRSSRGCG